MSSPESEEERLTTDSLLAWLSVSFSLSLRLSSSRHEQKTLVVHPSPSTSALLDPTRPSVSSSASVRAMTLEPSLSSAEKPPLTTHLPGRLSLVHAQRKCYQTEEDSEKGRYKTSVGTLKPQKVSLLYGRRLLITDDKNCKTTTSSSVL